VQTVVSPVETATVTANRSEGVEINKVARSNNFAAIGDILSYEYIVRNTGNVTLTEPVTVTDDKIADVTCPANPGLVPGATLTCAADYSVVQSDLDLGTVTNIATASVGEFTSAPDTVEITGTQSPSLSIEKSTTASSISASEINVADDKIESVSCPALTEDGLLPGASLTCAADYTVTQLDLDNGFVTNIATASSTLNGELTTSEPSFVTPGDILSYEYVVTNEGNATLLSAVTVTDDKIATVTCPAVPAEGIAPGASLTCAADYTVTQADVDAGEVTNLATASTVINGETVSSPEVTETVEADLEPRLSVTKTTLSNRQLFGPIFEVEYALNLENTGNVTLTDLQLDDDLAEAFAPATVVGTPVIESSDLSLADNYDGVSLIDLLRASRLMIQM